MCSFRQGCLQTRCSILHRWQTAGQSRTQTEKMSRSMTKPIKWHVRRAKSQISLGIPRVWSESSLSTWTDLGFLATNWARREDSDQSVRMTRLIWVFAGRTGHFVGFICAAAQLIFYDPYFTEYQWKKAQTLASYCYPLWMFQITFVPICWCADKIWLSRSNSFQSNVPIFENYVRYI